MIQLREEIRDGRQLRFYQPSGRVLFLPFIAMMILGVLVSAAFAFVLYLAEAHFYYFVFVPFLLYLPTMGMTGATMSVSRCRLPMLGLAGGLFLSIVFYCGYWNISYMLNWWRHDPAGVSQYVREESGLPGTLGYFVLRANNTAIESTPGSSSSASDADPYFAYMFYGIEFLLILGAGPAIGYARSSRVYNEEVNSWTAETRHAVGPGGLRPVYDAIFKEDYAALQGLPWTPVTVQNNKAAMVILALEYTPGYPSTPLFLTLKSSNMGRDPVLKELPGSGFGLGRTFFKRLYVDPKHRPALAQFLPPTEQPTPAPPVP